MARPKSSFFPELAERAQKDLDRLDRGKAVRKLRAILSAAKHPVATVAEITGVTPQTLCRWVASYRKEGLAGLYPKPKRPKPSKLTEGQKAAVRAWLEGGKTAGGKDTHWTLERLRQAIGEEFGVALGVNAIWVWLRKEGWRHKAPRPRHCGADGQAQADFKKN